MNNYDDIKRFKEKLNLEGIDYKEIVENHPNNTANNWAIIKQVATADEPFHPLDHGRSTQPTPTPVSHQEFSASSFAQAEPVQPPFRAHQDPGLLNAIGESIAPTREQPLTSPLLSALSKVMPPAVDAAGSGANVGNFSVSGPSNTLHPMLGNQAIERPTAAPEFKSQVNALFETASRQDFTPAPPVVAQTPLRSPSGLPPRTSSPARSGDTKRFTTLFNRKSHLPAGITPTRDMSLALLLENIALCR
ncbi:hypothetical protein SJI19_04965 [Acerihabitans sp. TG2]|uniref:hypothetical protein n=1 Tax=Acerihabitans sp. TG2 TaxID=3096008 RepID=UPI002B22FD95|nr:hypothetical protein [Acerihabitans sp. TG2]MEA9389911.1 hypothetical protein [Acerihabitans sp. TG2]